ncbi:hypothetical protein EMIT0158MI4_20616 [Burkholderia ambifaria]
MSRKVRLCERCVTTLRRPGGFHRAPMARSQPSGADRAVPGHDSSQGGA